MKKRILSMFLVVGMLFSCVTVANASAFTQQSQAAQFQAFGGYIKDQLAGDGNDYVAGWGDTTADGLKLGNYGTFSKSDTTTGNSYLHIANGTYMNQVFDEVAASGVIHLSFDLQYGGDESGKSFLVEAITNQVNGEVDNNLPDSVNNVTKVTMVNVTHDGKTLKVLNSQTNDAWGKYLDKGWHKFDIVFDFPKSDYFVYADGELLGTMDTIAKIKGITIRDTSTHRTIGMYLDNIALYHYPETSGIPAVEMAADCGRNGVLTSGGTVNIGFSEYIENYEPKVSDFKVVNTATGKEADVKAVSKADTGVVLTFDAIEAGEYEVSFVNEDVVGAISKAKVSGKASFTATGVASISQSTDDRYLLSESFDKYNGGMPAGWAPLLTTQTVAAESANLEKVAGVSGNALAVKGNGDIFFEFPNPIASGELTVEFDINSADGIWGMGFLHGKDFADPEIFKSILGTEEDNKTLDERRQRSLLVGNDTATDGDAVTLKYKPNRDYDNFFNGEAEGFSVKKNEWTHIKVKFDFDGYKFYLTVGDKTSEFDVNDKYSRAYPYQTIADNKATSFYGLKALRLAALGSTGVSVDNVKIYTEDSYNLYEDFDNWKTGKVNHRTSIFDFNNAFQINRHTIEMVAGRTGETGDTAMKITKTNNGGLVMPFVSPVTKNHSFNVEFDFKQSDVTYSDTLALALFNNGDFNIGQSAFTSRSAIVFATSGYRGGSATHADDVKPGSIFFGCGGLDQSNMPLFTSSTDKNTITSYDIQADKWYHINFKVRGTLYELEITDEAGTTSSFYMIDGTRATMADGNVALHSGKLSSYKIQANNDTYAIAFFNPRAANKEGGAQTTIDNVKVYEVNEPDKASIASAKVVYTDGEANLGSSVYANAEQLVVTTTVPFRTTDDALDDISVTYGDTGEAVTDNITLSEDKMTITATFDEEVETGRPVVFEISNKALWAESYISSEENHKIEFMFANPEEKLTVNDFRIYDYQSNGTVSGWTPVIDTTLEKNYTADNQLKVSVSGRNDYKTAKTLTAIFAVYDTESGILKAVAPKSVTVNSESDFEFAIYSANTAEGLLEGNATTIDLTDGDRIKCFIWEDINTSMRPLKANLDYTKWTTVAK